MKTTEVAVDKQPTEVQVRMKVQAVLQKNLRTPLGMFHGKELNERGFVNDLFKNFDITPKKDEK
jgi:hypothetical protein